MDLIRVASSEHLLNGVAVSPEGRVFSSFPRWTSVSTPSVAEAMPDGSFKPYPGNRWNAWEPGLSPHDRMVSAHAVFADSRNHLWVVDDAAPRVVPAAEGAAKLVLIDLASDCVSRVYPLGSELLPKGSMIGHVRVDERFAYVSEAHHGAIIVVDLESGRGRNLLSRDGSTRADPSIVPVIEGREFRRSDGKVPLLHVDLLELSGDGKWLYFTPLFGPVLRRVETRFLQDDSLADEEIAAHVEDVVRVPPLAGITRDRHGNFYFCSITEDAILRMDSEHKLQTLVSDPRISFPNEPAAGPDGYLYFPSSQIHRLPLFGGGASRVIPPFEVFKLRLPK